MRLGNAHIASQLRSGCDAEFETLIALDGK